MKIYSMKDGTWIELDNTGELSRCYDIMCTCGHPLKLHGFFMNWGTNTLFTSQCTVCGIVDNEFVCNHFTPTDDLK